MIFLSFCSIYASANTVLVNYSISGDTINVSALLHYRNSDSVDHIFYYYDYQTTVSGNFICSNFSGQGEKVIDNTINIGMIANYREEDSKGSLRFFIVKPNEDLFYYHKYTFTGFDFKKTIYASINFFVFKYRDLPPERSSLILEPFRKSSIEKSIIIDYDEKFRVKNGSFRIVR
jgi:hypothetical protein